MRLIHFNTFFPVCQEIFLIFTAAPVITRKRDRGGALPAVCYERFVFLQNSVIRHNNPPTDQAVGGFAAGRSPLFRRVRFIIAFTVKKCYNTADEYYSHFS